MSRQKQGFTLIEMLVVILIIGILLGITLLSPVTGSVHKRLQQQATRLEVLFAQIRDKALLENVEYGFSVDAEGTYQWWLLPQESKAWVQLEESPFQPYKVSGGLNIWLESDEQMTDFTSDDESPGPSVVFYSDRQATPFRLHIVAVEDRKQSVVLLSDGLSDVEVTR